MRVTANTFPNALLNPLSSLSQRQNKLQNQAATGQIVSLPEDDPVAMRRILDMQAENGALAQYQRNIIRHQELATATYDSLKALKSLSDKAGEIAIAAGDLNAANLPIYAKQVTELGHNGALQSRLEASVSLTSQRMDTLEKLVSKEADADLTETIVRLTQTQTAYQAALQSAGRILGSSLLDYLR